MRSLATALVLTLLVTTVYSKDKDGVIVKGTITGVMEVFPLRLTLKSGAKEYQIQLSKDTVVTKGKQKVSPGVLREDQMISVEGKKVSGGPADWIAADKIIIQESP
jgi:hypothetical protein